jgi:plastocyanin
MTTRSPGHMRPYALTKISTFAFSALMLAALPATADDSASLTIRNHRFEPATISVKAGTKIKLTVHNAQSEAAEFESSELNREKVVAPGSTITVYVGPLEPGTYGFFDDFHQATTGQIVAK